MITVEVKNLPTGEVREYYDRGTIALFSAIGEILVEESKRTFVEQRDPYGVPWAPHSDVTEMLREAEGKPGQILTKDGYLRNSVTYSPEQVASDKTKVVVFAGGPAASYAAKMHFGDPNNLIFGRHPAPVPSRKFFPTDDDGNVVLTDETMAEIESAQTLVENQVNEWIQSGSE